MISAAVPMEDGFQDSDYVPFIEAMYGEPFEGAASMVTFVLDYDPKDDLDELDCAARARGSPDPCAFTPPPLPDATEIMPAAVRAASELFLGGRCHSAPERAKEENGAEALKRCDSELSLKRRKTQDCPWSADRDFHDDAEVRKLLEHERDHHISLTKSARYLDGKQRGLLTGSLACTDIPDIGQSGPDNTGSYKLFGRCDTAHQKPAPTREEPVVPENVGERAAVDQLDPEVLLEPEGENPFEADTSDRCDSVAMTDTALAHGGTASFTLEALSTGRTMTKLLPACIAWLCGTTPLDPDDLPGGVASQISLIPSARPRRV